VRGAIAAALELRFEGSTLPAGVKAVGAVRSGAGRDGYNARVHPAVAIAGGGLSGLSSALLLARAGFDVTVYERKPVAGGRFAGGWQILENGSSPADVLEELAAAGFPRGVPVHPLHRAVLLDGFGRRFEVASQRPFAYFVRRGAGEHTLDSWLLGLLEQAGGRVVRGVEPPTAVQVVATGPRQADGVAREVVFTSRLADTALVLFDPAVTPTGYAYLFSLGGHGTFGVAQVRRTASLRAAQKLAWRRFRDLLGEFPLEVVHEGGQYMNFSIPTALQDGAGRWWVGEAAGVQDYLFGLGNRLAMRSAALAVGGLLGQWDGAAFENGLRRPMATSVGLRCLFEALGRRGLAALCRAAAGGDFRDFLLRLQRPRLATTLLATVARWVWRERRGCRHGALCQWCRRREG
jgi:flavin-dependent dehydrogenase